MADESQLPLGLEPEKKKKDPRGGRRPGAGRKPNPGGPGVVHLPRSPVTKGEPLLVWMKVMPDVARKMRSKQAAEQLECELEEASWRADFQVHRWAVLGKELRLVVMADDRAALSRGMKGLKVRVARGLNRLWGRKGTFFADRYDDRPLSTVKELEDALDVFASAPRSGTLLD